jgi:glucokinase
VNDMEYILGIDVGGTKIAVVLGDSAGHVYERQEFATRTERGFLATFDEICTHANAMLSKAMAEDRPPKAVSVSIGGPLDIARGVIYSPPNLPGWDNVPLKRLLEEKLDLPCHVEHDGNAGALAEWHFGAGKGARNVIFLTMGTGMGGGLILNGRLYRGTSDLAGEVGHMRISEEGPTAYGKAGSWEAFCSGTGIVRLAALRFPVRWPEGSITVRALADMAQGGDREAAAVFSETGRYLGRGLAVLLDILNPEIIVVGSLAVRLGELILGPAREEVVREALPGAVSACRIVPAKLGERIGDVASMCAAIEAMRPGRHSA